LPSEVKTLAQQTANATSEISARIHDIQHAVKEKVEAITSCRQASGGCNTNGRIVAERARESIRGAAVASWSASIARRWPGQETSAACLFDRGNILMGY
jgi:hypothetical protein